MTQFHGLPNEIWPFRNLRTHFHDNLLIYKQFKNNFMSRFAEAVCNKHRKWSSCKSESRLVQANKHTSSSRRNDGTRCATSSLLYQLNCSGNFASQVFGNDLESLATRRHAKLTFHTLLRLRVFHSHSRRISHVLKIHFSRPGEKSLFFQEWAHSPCKPS